MAQTFTSQELQDLAVFPFKQSDWQKKFVIGSLVAIAGYLLVVPFVFLYGHGVELMRRVIEADAEPFIPEWDDWGKIFSDGIKPVGVGFIYMLPLFLLMICGYALFFSSIFVPALAAETSGGDPGALGIIPAFGFVGFTGMIFAVMVLGLAVGAILPVVIAHVVATDDFAAGFHFAEIWRIFKANWGGFLLTYVIVMVFSFMLSFVFQLLYLTIIGCCFLPFLIPVFGYYMTLIYAVLFGRAYRAAIEELEAVAA